jgi:hypothetical protein
MRIELPSSGWADTQRAQDDAHTLTLPAQRALGIDPLLGRDEEEGACLRVEVELARPVTLTLTL